MLDVRTTMRRAMTFNRNRVAIASGGKSLTFEAAWDRGLRLANGLASLGLVPGDRVAVLEENRLESADFFLGTAAGGLIRVPLYRRNGAEAHRHMLNQVGAKAVVVDESCAPELEGIQQEVPTLEHIVVRDGKYEDWLAEFPADDPEPPVALDDPYLIRFSAGTTGLPKGITYSHRAWLSAMRDWCYLLPPVAPGDVCLHVGPISHGSGYIFTPVWIGGGTNLLVPSFDPVGTPEIIENERVAFMFAVPTMLAAMLAVPDIAKRDFSSLKAVIISAAPIAPRTARNAREVFGPKLFQMYGQTEAVPAAFMGPQEWFEAVEGSDPITAAGRVMPFAEIEIRGEENEPLPIGSEGEIAIRNEGQMIGIWGDDEATRRRIVDGWVLTGDVGRLDENGYLYILDRKDDLIISGGFNIWPLELERVIGEDDRIREVAVFGVPHEKWGETPLALCVVDELDSITKDEIVAICADRLGSYKKPGEVVLQTEPLRKSPVGKLQRKVLREPYWADETRRIRGS